VKKKGKNAVARGEAEWTWEARPGGEAEEVVAWVAEQLGNVASREKAAQMLLPMAVRDDVWAVVDLLLVEGARVDGEAMVAAIHRGDPALLRRLIAAGGDVDGIGMEGPVIFDAILRGDQALVAVLFDEGANLEIEYGLTMGTPLMYAAFLGDRGMVELLLERGANPRAFYEGDTAASVAVRRGHEEIVDVLRRAEERAARSAP
jgi:ankyrin repeat protein